ncbi:MAG: large conductance mechanosensitive channel protein MscL [Ruminococcaceae bacterium]|nr:large conductance mechanosensitive channel protein MscL [Oscillospiraceae bacterium]
MSKKNGKKSLWQEFKEFAIKGNAMALAVGTIIGAAFKTITDSLTNDVIMPVVNIFLGGADFTELKVALPRAPWVEPEYVAKVNEAGEAVLNADGTPVMEEVVNYLTWGNFLSAVINFVILAFVVFMIVKGLNKLGEIGKKKEEEAPAAPPAPSNEEVLLGEIRDLLKENKK